MIEQFKRDVNQGLSSTPKELLSKYFYDEKGDELFVKIMHTSEYYLTDAELEIFSEKTNQIIDALELTPDIYFNLIELGAGDGLKSIELLHKLIEEEYQFKYSVVDISKNALDKFETNLMKTFPSINFSKIHGDYFEILNSLEKPQSPCVILFLGSNIGNMSNKIANQFICNISSYLKYNDKVLIGVDLIKDSSIVLPAYNDHQGITKAFNLNLLERINRELGANFDISSFVHHPIYSEQENAAKSYLVSVCDQKVFIKALNKEFHFKKGEKIHTETSQKYNDEIMYEIISDSEFTITHKITDSKNYFADYILKRL